MANQFTQPPWLNTEPGSNEVNWAQLAQQWMRMKESSEGSAYENFQADHQHSHAMLHHSGPEPLGPGQPQWNYPAQPSWEPKNSHSLSSEPWGPRPPGGPTGLNDGMYGSCSRASGPAMTRGMMADNSGIGHFPMSQAQPPFAHAMAHSQHHSFPPHAMPHHQPPYESQQHQYMSGREPLFDSAAEAALHEQELHGHPQEFDIPKPLFPAAGPGVMLGAQDMDYRKMHRAGLLDSPDPDMYAYPDVQMAEKRKLLPSWIREGLEKMEKEKLKKEQQLRNQELGKMASHDVEGRTSKSKFDDEGDSKEDGDDLGRKRMSMSKSPSPEKAASNSEKGKSSPSLEAEDEPEPPRKSPEELRKDLWLTELLLEVTNEEIADISSEVDKRYRQKAPARILAQSNALAAICGLGGDDDSNDDSEGNATDDSIERSSSKRKSAEITQKARPSSRVEAPTPPSKRSSSNRSPIRASPERSLKEEHNSKNGRKREVSSSNSSESEIKERKKERRSDHGDSKKYKKRSASRDSTEEQRRKKNKRSRSRDRKSRSSRHSRKSKRSRRSSPERRRRRSRSRSSS